MEIERAKDNEHRLTAVEDRAASNTRRINDLEKRQDDLDNIVSTVKVLAEKEKNIECTVNEIKNDVKSLTNKPGQRWDSLIDKIILTIAAAVVGFVLAQIGF